MTTLTKTASVSIGTPFTQAELQGLGANAYLLGSTRIARPASVTRVDFRLKFPSGVTLAAGPLTLSLIPIPDGTNAVQPPTGNIAAPQQYYAGTYNFSGGTILELLMQEMPIPNYDFFCHLSNGSATAFPTTGTYVVDLLGYTYQG